MPAATFPDISGLCADLLTTLFFGPLATALLGAGL